MFRSLLTYKSIISSVRNLLPACLVLGSILSGSVLARAAESLHQEPALSIRGGSKSEIDVFQTGATLFTDRGFVVAECPPLLEGKNFLRHSIESVGLRIDAPGELIVLTPEPGERASTQAEDLKAQGFKQIDIEAFQLFGKESFNRVIAFSRKVEAGETYWFGKFVVVLGLSMVDEWERAAWNENTGELLYNGIRLPADEWPPRNIAPVPRGKPMEVPYLDHRPELVPIDVGRQLFVDDFLIEETTLNREFHLPEKYKGNPVLKPETELELNAKRVAPVFFGEPGAPAAVPKSGGVWWDPKEQHFKMWYEAGWLNTIALATSKDGIHWERPEFDIRPGTNQVLPVDMTPDSWTVVPNYDSSDPAARYTMFITAPGADQPGHSMTSPDGIHWNNRTKTGVMGDRSTHFYNPFRKKWVYSLRTYFNHQRARQYYECDDFMAGASWSPSDRIPWLMTDENDLVDAETGEKPQLYNFDAAPYESLMLGMFQVHNGPDNLICHEKGLPKITELQFAYSRDGFHWDRPDRRIAISASRKDVWDRGYVQPIGNICVIQGDKLWFYYSAFQGNEATAGNEWMQDGGMYSHGSTGVATLRRDGFASMTAGNKTGVLTTRPVLFTGRHLFINADVPNGRLRAEVRDESGNPIAPFTLENSIPFTGDSTLQELTWQGISDLSVIAGKPIRFHFEVQNGSLYAFWVSRDVSGRSDGYVAGGGPGYTGPTDTVGKSALNATASRK